MSQRKHIYILDNVIYFFWINVIKEKYFLTSSEKSILKVKKKKKNTHSKEPTQVPVWTKWALPKMHRSPTSPRSLEFRKSEGRDFRGQGQVLRPCFPRLRWGLSQSIIQRLSIFYRYTINAHLAF